MLTASPKRLLGLALLTCFVAAVFGAKPLADWVDASIVAGTFCQQAADAWSDTMRRVGLEQPYEVLRRAVRDAEAARFGGGD